ncbi:ATP-binding protein [Streptomyces sp. O3]
MTGNPVRNTQTTQPSTLVHHFAMRFTSTPRGARLARRLCGKRLAAWGIPYGTEAHDTLTLIAAELCANAVRHGRVPGRDFGFRLTAVPGAGEPAGVVVRVAVTDTRGDRLPVLAPVDLTGPPRPGGRGLRLVGALADRWDCEPRVGAPGKTVWAECLVTTSAAQTSRHG